MSRSASSTFVAAVAALCLAPATGAASRLVAVPTLLGTLGGSYSYALRVTASGAVAGNNTPPGASGFYWTASDGMRGIGTPDPFGITSVADMNDAGAVVGYARHAFYWTPAGGMRDIGTLGGDSSAAVAVNASGQTIGWSDRETQGRGSFSWTPAGGIVDLGTLGGNFSYPEAINDRGTVVGESTTTGTGAWHAFSWTASGGMIDLGPNDGGVISAINNNGDIVGRSGPHASLWTAAGDRIDLGTLGGDSSTALAVNERRQVVGWSITGSRELHAFSWTPEGGMVDLGRGVARAVNSSGLVVGSGFAWTQREGRVELPAAGYADADAFDVNDAGDIVGVVESPVPCGSRFCSTRRGEAVLWRLEQAPSEAAPREPEGVFLCYSKWQVDPGVWLFPEAWELSAAGYWRPYAMLGTATSTRLGAYSLVCSLPLGSAVVAGAAVDGGGDLVTDSALVDRLGFYPIAR